MLPSKKDVLLPETRKTISKGSGACFACGKETSLKSPQTCTFACSIHLQLALAYEEFQFRKI